MERVKSRCDAKEGGESWKELRVDVMLRGRRELERGKSRCDAKGEERVGKS